MTNPIPAVQHASVYRPDNGRHTTCRHANNSAGHNENCECGWAKVRDSQRVPYADHPYEDCAADCRSCQEQAWWHRERFDKAKARAQ